MNDSSKQSESRAVSASEIGEYCRQVEDYLTRVNGGHLVRIVGPGFEVVRQWAEESIPLRIVFRGIDRKVERHQSGASKRPLRIEFCAGDVRDLDEQWRRAVGLTTGYRGTEPATEAGGEVSGEAADASDRKRPSLTKHLDRVIEKLGRAAGRLELPELLRDGVGAMIGGLAEMRQEKPARGADREPREAQLAQWDRELIALARDTSPADLLTAVREDAERDLAVYRGRLSGDAWTNAVNATVNQLLRDRLGLPTIEL